MARNRSSVERCLCRLSCAGFLVFALVALAAPSEAADEYGCPLATSGEAADEYSCTPAPPSGAVAECDRLAQESCGFWDQYDRAPEKCCIWDDYDSKKAGHPLRIAAYVLHPVGVIIDWVIFRPAWWIGSHDPFYTLFGRTD